MAPVPAAVCPEGSAPVLWCPCACDPHGFLDQREGAVDFTPSVPTAGHHVTVPSEERPCRDCAKAGPRLPLESRTGAVCCVILLLAILSILSPSQRCPYSPMDISLKRRDLVELLTPLQQHQHQLVYQGAVCKLEMEKHFLQHHHSPQPLQPNPEGICGGAWQPDLSDTGCWGGALSSCCPRLERPHWSADAAGSSLARVSNNAELLQ